MKAASVAETLSLSGTTDTVDGVTVAAGDYVLYKLAGNISGAIPGINGLYRVAASTGKYAPVQPTVVVRRQRHGQCAAGVLNVAW